MKVFTSVLAIAMAVASVSAVAIEPMSDLEARCLANGKACKANGSLGNCCSGFCLAQGSVRSTSSSLQPTMRPS